MNLLLVYIFIKHPNVANVEKYYFKNFALIDGLGN